MRGLRQILDAVDNHELLRLVEVAGVAGMHPAVAHVDGGRGLVLVVAGEHVRVAHHDLADAVDVGITDFDLDIRRHRNAGGVGIDLIGLVQRERTERFGLAIERAQRHAHGAEEFERIRAERRAAGRRGAQPRKAEAVAQRAEQQRIGQRRMLAVGERSKADFQPTS